MTRGIELIKGKQYDLSNMELLGWNWIEGNFDPDIDGYSIEYFFDSDGRYLGHDQHGVYPILFEK